MAILPVGIGPQEGGYQIERSLRFNSADSAYLSRTPASAGNRKTWTLSMWVKRSALGSDQTLLGVNATTDYTQFKFSSSDTLRLYLDVDALNYAVEVPTVVWRDPSSWYHIVLAMDTTQATSTNRVKMYVNGVQQTVSAISGYNIPAQNWDTDVNATLPHAIGNFNYLNTQYLNGYLTEINFIDGQALDPTSFGEYNSETGVWQPKAYTGSYGTNGFYLNFSDNSNNTAATLGKDYSGNGNNWTPNNFSVTAGAGNDSLVDTPTNYGTDTGVGGEVRGNYATFNAIAKTSNVTLTNGNLDAAFGTVSGGGGVIATIAPSSGKWYWEVTVTAVSSASIHIGVIKDVLTTFSGTQYYEPGLTADGYAYQNDGTKYNNNTNTSYGASYTTNDVIGVAMDLDAGTLTFYKNGTSQGQAFSGLSGGYFPAVGDGSSAGTHSVTANFGQRPFAYTAPSGYKALCTQNLPEPTVVDGGEYFNAVLYTGNGSTQSITGVGFQPDLVWAKCRSNSYHHKLVDAVRGATLTLSSSQTAAEQTETNSLTAFNSDGFSLGSISSMNASAETFVAWNWKANGAGVSNTDGSITSTVSANTTSGFSIVTSGVSTSAFTVGHGLGVAPAMMISKPRNVADSWYVYHQSLAATESLRLNTTGAVTTGGFNGTRPTSTVLTLSGFGSSSYTNVVYCFAPVEGYSAFGSYVGNGSNQFVYLGFRPRYVMVKSTSAGQSWIIQDSNRSPYNVTNQYLTANAADAEGSGVPWDYFSNGFRLTTSSANDSGQTFIYMAFAENPFKYSLAR